METTTTTRAKRFERDLRGITVVGRAGHVIGTLVDLVFDGLPGKIAALVVKVRASVAHELHLPTHFWRSAELVVPLDRVTSVADVMILDRTLEELSLDYPAETAASRAPVIEETESARQSDTPEEPRP